jgi:hypothetical protein
MAEHYYAWVRVGDGEPEPAAIEGEKPDRTATTFGCPDKFKVDDPTSGCSVVLVVNANYAHPTRQSDNYWDRYSRLNGRAREAVIRSLFDEYPAPVEVTTIERDERERRFQQAIREKPHNYAGFGRRAA